jgi:hypothetical protein
MKIGDKVRFTNDGSCSAPTGSTARVVGTKAPYIQVEWIDKGDSNQMDGSYYPEHFEVIEETTPLIVFKDRDVHKMGDLSRFKNLQILEMNNTKLSNIHSSICSLPYLEIMVLRDNVISSLPNEIGNLRSLVFLNVLGNKINNIPESIKYLDKSNGGNLHKIAVNVDDIGIDNYNKLKELLPTTIID